MKNIRSLAIMLCLVLCLSACAAPHTQIPLQTPMPTLAPTPEATPAPTPAAQMGKDTTASSVSYNPYALPLSLRSGEAFSTALYKMVMDAAAAGETEVSMVGMNVSAAQVDSVRSFVLERGQNAVLSDISLQDDKLLLKYTTEDAAAPAQAAQDFDKATSEILTLCCKPGYTLLQCAMAVYQYLGQNVEYSYENMDDGLYGALVNKKAVASGYAHAFAFLMDQIGIENVLAVAPDQSHIWNIITIDGASYHVDATFGANMLKGQSMKFFGMNDASAEAALGYSGWTAATGAGEAPLPVCSSSRFALLQQAGRSDVDYAGNAVFLDQYDGLQGIYRLDIASGEVENLLPQATDGIAVMGNMLYYILSSDGYMYACNLETGDTVQLFEGEKMTAIERRGDTVYYAAENSAEKGQISP